jgi:methionyl-tRNA formyltransferase
MLRIIFAGTPEFAVPTLKKLIASEHEVVGVYTQPDRPAGRGQQIQASSIKQLAESHDLPIFQPKTLRDATVQDQMRALNADIMVVVAYGLILPESVLKIPRLGCVNLHPSLLPRWRGAAPIPRSLEAGDLHTGITIMQLDKGMDTGPILKQEEITLTGFETSELLHDQFSVRGAELMLETVHALENNSAIAVSQNHELATHAAKIDKKEAVIDWSQSAVVIANKVRAFNSWPVAQTVFQKQTLRIWCAKAIDEKTVLAPGSVIRFEKEAFFVATGHGVLQVTSVQLPGKKRMCAMDFINGYLAHVANEKIRLG